jgi:catechol 2,3-dioxygenase-like lactoylglutathione lyase family enzyme
MVKTHGLSHVALSVVDLDRSLTFYRSVFGVREFFRNDSTVQVLGPGQFDVLVFEKRPSGAGVPGGIIHFGFRLTRPEDIDVAVAAVESAGAPSLRAVSLRPAYPMPMFGIPTAMKLR